MVAAAEALDPQREVRRRAPCGPGGGVLAGALGQLVLLVGAHPGVGLGTGGAPAGQGAGGEVGVQSQLGQGSCFWFTARLQAGDNGDDSDDDDDDAKVEGKNVGVLTVAAVTFANGGDNIGVYVPVFLNVGPVAVVAYCVVFLLLVAILVMLAKFTATRRPFAEVLERWEHVLFPIVLIGLGIFILVSGLAVEN